MRRVLLPLGAFLGGAALFVGGAAAAFVGLMKLEDRTQARNRAASKRVEL